MQGHLNVAILCEDCGKPHNRQGTTVCAECAQKRLKEKKKQESEVKKLKRMEVRKHRKCKYCGKEFDASADSDKFVKLCPSCKSQKNNGVKVKEAYEKAKEAEEAAKKAKSKRYTMSELIRMASERGISYGQLSRELNL